MSAREGPVESGIIIPVPAAEPLVGTWRAELDSGAWLGVPAHVTVLYPFASPRDLDDGVRAAVADLASAIEPFEATFTEVRRFGDDVLYLAPEPRSVFDDLLARAAARWPEHPPYGGEHDEVVPHLTVGDNGDRAGYAEAAAALRRRLPLGCTVDRLEVVVGGTTQGSWHQRWSFPLGG